MIKGKTLGLYTEYDPFYSYLILAKLMLIISLHLNNCDKSYDTKWQSGEKKSLDWRLREREMKILARAFHD